MFRFEEPTYLYLLLLLPFLAAFYLYSNYRRRSAIKKFGDPELMAQLMPDVSKYRPDVKFWLLFAAIGLFAVLLARPQFGSRLETVRKQSIGQRKRLTILQKCQSVKYTVFVADKLQ